ncbi:hypothetical protein AK812_SmicGene3929 [Symbiodinium microadriaticum]|uniref:Uncharacterized protein n=1 Tax=Symbiodinium microadriaticum TaxID=2951 RepID=A0A1Q9EXR3_SYMMI|nr:hypothetical protein AK812_SmicGene3929 [Symbiodinium microadriaticum]
MVVSADYWQYQHDDCDGIEEHGITEISTVRGIGFPAKEKLQSASLPEPSFDRTTFNSAITACIDGKTWNVALWMFGSLVKESLKPDHVTFTGAACACAIGGAWTSTLELLSLLPPPMRPRAAGSRLAELTRGISKYWPGEEDDARSAQNLRTLGVHKEFMRLRKERTALANHSAA